MSKITWILVGVFSIFPLCQGQKSPIAIEIERRQRVKRILRWQYSKKPEARNAYLQMLEKQEKDRVLPFLPPSVKYIETLEKAIREFTNIAPVKSHSGKYLTKLFENYRILVSEQQWRRLCELYRKKGTTGICKEVASWTQTGLYPGCAECIRKNLLRITFKAKLKQRIETQYTDVLKSGDITRIREFLDKNPSYISQGGVFLGDIYFAQGKLNRALGAWQRVRYLNCPMSHQKKREVVARIAMASWITEDRVLFYKIRKQYRKDQTSIAIMGSKLPLSQFLKNIPSLMAKKKESKVWNNWRGNASHSSLAPSVDLRHGLKALPAYSFSCRFDQFFPQPLLWHGRLYYNFPGNPFCLELKTGRLGWSQMRGFARGFSSRCDHVKHYLATGTISRDRFYFFSYPQKYRDKNMQFYSTENNYRLGNTLYCVDAKDGRLLWKWPSSDGGNAIFNTAPAIVENRLFVGATVLSGQMNAELFCFETQGENAGTLLWKRSVCEQMGSGYAKKVPLRYGNGISIGYGMIYYCSNLGVIAAIDAQSGEIRWLVKYKQTLQNYRLRCAKQKWYNTPPVVKHGRLYVTPTDSPYLYIYDAFDGTLQRKFPDTRGNDQWTHLVGVGKKGTIYLAGSRKITALQDNGANEIIWSEKLPEPLRGIGVVSRRWIYLPTSGGLLQIDTISGKASKVLTTTWSQEGSPVTAKTPVSVLVLAVDGENYIVLTSLNRARTNRGYKAIITIYKKK